MHNETMKSTELKKIIKICKQNGVNHIKFEGIELDFQPGYGDDRATTIPIEPMPSDEDMLFASADTIEEVTTPTQ